MGTFVVYVLYSPSAKRFYVGQTQNVLERLQKHNRGDVQSTRSFQNAIDSAFRKGAFPKFRKKTFLVLGAPDTSVRKPAPGAISFKAAGDVKQYYRNLGKHRGSVVAKCFSGKISTLKAVTQTDGNYYNPLSTDLLPFKLALGLSRVGIGPSGLGDLLYNDLSGTNPLNELSLDQIAALADTALTFGCLRGYAQADFDRLDSAIVKVNRAFIPKVRDLGTLDSANIVSFSPLHVTGIQRLMDIPFLHRDPKKVPFRNIFTPTVPIVDGDDAELPEVYSLEQNYPNPFNPTTTIEFSLPVDAFVTLKIYNILGQEVATLLDHENLDAGPASAMFDAGRLASGVYFYRITAEGRSDDGTTSSFTSAKKMLLVR